MCRCKCFEMKWFEVLSSKLTSQHLCELSNLHLCHSVTDRNKEIPAALSYQAGRFFIILNVIDLFCRSDPAGTCRVCRFLSFQRHQKISAGSNNPSRLLNFTPAGLCWVKIIHAVIHPLNTFESICEYISSSLFSLLFPQLLC